MSKTIDLRTFVNDGYLQEVNRMFFHPLGLALAVEFDEHDDPVKLAGILDYRDDPEGVLFSKPNLEKVQRILDITGTRQPARLKALGYWIQPVEEPTRE